MQGARASSTSETAPTNNLDANTTDKHNSVSQQSYDNQIENFEGLVELVASHTKYKPNEAHLKTDTVKALLTTLKNNNSAVINSDTNWSNSRVSSNQLTKFCKFGIDTKSWYF